MKLDDRLLDVMRAKYQSDMKIAVSILSNMLKDNPYGNTVSANHINRVDEEIGNFMMAKERLTYFEAIIKNLNDEKEK